MIKSVGEYIREVNGGIMPMVGRERGRAEYYITCLSELKRGEMYPCWYNGEPAMCTMDEADTEGVQPVTWEHFFRYATQDIQTAISREWAILLGDTLVLRRLLPDSKVVELESYKKTELEAFNWLQKLRRDTLGDIER